MTNYKELSVVGTSYVRGRSMYFENPLDNAPSVLVREEQITNLADRTVQEPSGEIRKIVTDLAVQFPILDPQSNTPIPGMMMSYQDLYVALYSLYWHLAQERDIRAQEQIRDVNAQEQIQLDPIEGV